MKIKNVKLKPGFTLKELGGEFCIFDERDSQCGSLNGLPSVNEICIFLWNSLERGAGVGELITLLSEEKNIDEEDAIDRLNDNIVTALRTSHGLDLSKIPSKYKKQIIADAEPSLRAGHIELSDDHLRIPAHHWLTSDTIIRQLIILH